MDPAPPIPMETDVDLMEGVECAADDALPTPGTSAAEPQIFDAKLESDAAESASALRPPASASVAETVKPSAGKQIALAPKQIAIAPKPVKKISLSNLRPKGPTDGAGRHVVVVPTTNGRIKVIGAGTTSPQIDAPQIVRAGTSQIVQLRHPIASPPPLTKIAAVQPGDAVAKTTTRYISLQQAQQMGLVSGGKIHQLVNVSPVKQGSVPSNSIVRPAIRQTVTSVKTPTKILPAPPKGVNNAGKLILTAIPLQTQNVAIKTANASKPQLLKVDNVSGSGNTILASLQPGQRINPQRIHQINVPGKGVQLVRLVNASPTQIQKIGNSSPVRIAPMTTASSPRTLQTASKIVQSKTPQVLTKPFMFDMQGNIVQLASTDGQNLLSSNQGMTLKRVIGGSQAKIVPMNINIGSPTKIIQTTSASMSTSNISTYQIKCKDEISDVEETPLVQIGKTELVDEEVAENKNFRDNEMMGGSQQLLKDNSSPGNFQMQSDMKHIVMVPASYIQQIQGENANSKPLSIAANVEIKQIENKAIDCSLEFGMRPRKPCNCTKSQCLKLYCDCFANGEFCNMCNCNNCHNNLANEEFRQKAIRTCLERNPNAFRPKIGKAKNYGLEVIRRHNKGCNCKRSGCLKNYCECYEGKIACSANCKCIGCRNIEDILDKRSLRKTRNEVILGRMGVKNDDVEHDKDLLYDVSNRNEIMKKEAMSKLKKPWSFMTTDVIEAVCNCLIAQATESETSEGQDSTNATRFVLDEFARCLEDMINTAQAFPTANTGDGREVSI